MANELPDSSFDNEQENKAYRKDKGEFLKNFPIPMVSYNAQCPFIELVDRILAITQDEDYLQNPDKQAKVKELEREIDKMVYELYGLTEEEIAIVEGKKN